jgi:hypothetical protein
LLVTRGQVTRLREILSLNDMCRRVAALFQAAVKAASVKPSDPFPRRVIVVGALSSLRECQASDQNARAQQNKPTDQRFKPAHSSSARGTFYTTETNAPAGRARMAAS